MISISGKKWKEKKVNLNLVNKIQQDKNFSKLVSHLIVSRNFDLNEIHLIKNELDLKNIFENNLDFIKSVKLLQKSINNKENVCILGDYDVDGSAATKSGLKFLYVSIIFSCKIFLPEKSFRLLL